ncbi:MAG: class F sortase [Acidimicrobiaceae bacterium]|nr:class F sortase [Acidimicrobiaceae bacterium]
MSCGAAPANTTAGAASAPPAPVSTGDADAAAAPADGADTGEADTGEIAAAPAAPLSATAASGAAASETRGQIAAGALTSIWAPQDLTPPTDQHSQDPQDPQDARLQAPNPSVVRIPRLGVQAPIVPLGLQDDGTIEVPERADLAGWWLGGPEPGETGPAVILGHVDSEESEGVFFHLRYLSSGDEIHIDRVDGSTVTYVVEHLETHDKDAFPTDAVYGPTEAPTLRLVTCGGDYDFDERTYPDNVVVFASHVDTAIGT